MIRFMALLALVSLSGSSCKEEPSSDASSPSSQGSEIRSEQVPVRIQTLQPSTYQEFGDYLGTVQAMQEVRLLSHAGGRVDKLIAERGDRVKKGQKLCSIEGKQYEVQFESAKLSEKLAKEKFDRTKIHVSRNTASRTQLDLARLDYLAKQQVRIETQRLYEGAHCISPIDGIVVDRLIQPYENTSPGQATYYVAQNDKVRIEVGIPETEIDGYQVGREAFVRIVGQDKQWPGKLTSLSQRVDTNQRTFTAEIQVENPDQILRSGMSARVRILRYNLQEKLVVPTRSILVLAKENAVMVVENGLAVKRRIEQASNNGEDTLIKSGLNFGDKLIVEGQMQAVDGAQVMIIE